MIENNYKIGDKIILLDGYNIHTLEKNKAYTIKDISHRSHGIFISIEEDFIEEPEQSFIEEPYIRYRYYNIKRFKKDIKFERLKKINKIINQSR